MSRIRFLIFIITLGLLGAAALGDDIVQDDRVGYAFRLAPGWMQAPPEAVAQANAMVDRAMRDRAGTYHFALYTDEEDWFERPYALVQFQQHPTPLFSHRDLEMFMDGLGESLAEAVGSRPHEREAQQAADSASDLLTGDWWVDDQQGVLAWTSRREAGPESEDADVFIASVMHVGVDGTVTFHGYFDDEPSSEELAAFLGIAGSLEFAPQAGIGALSSSSSGSGQQQAPTPVSLVWLVLAGTLVAYILVRVWSARAKH